MSDTGDEEKQPAAPAKSSDTAAAAPADMQAFIGRQLRAVYDDIAKQPVPDRFIELMKQLDTKPAGR
jgi:Anti-sigma factor NepR